MLSIAIGLVGYTQLNAFVQAFAGTLAATLSFWLTYPLFTISTILQKASQTRLEAALKSDWDLSGLSEYFSSFRGFRKLFAGIWPATVANILSTFLYMTIYELLKARFVISNRPTLREFSVCAFVAGSATSIFANPFWVVHADMIRQESVHVPNVQFGKTIRSLLDQHGYIIMFKGLLPSFVLSMNAPLQNSLFDYFTNSSIANAFNGNATFSEKSRSAIVSKFVPSVLLYPFILIRTQLYDCPDGSSFSRMLKVIQSVLRGPEGFFGFYKGLSWKLIQSLVTITITVHFKTMFVYILNFISGLDVTLFTDMATGCDSKRDL